MLSQNVSLLLTGKWNHLDVAIKMQRPDTVKMAAFLDEAQILKTLDHPNIVRLLAVCSSSEPVYLVTEYMEKGRLSLYLREGEGSELKLTQLIWLGAQVGMTAFVLLRFASISLKTLVLLNKLRCHAHF